MQTQTHSKGGFGQFELFAPLVEESTAPQYHCAMANCDEPARDGSDWCGYHQSERTRPLWPYPRMQCRSWKCGAYAVPFGNGAFCREHKQVAA